MTDITKLAPWQTLQSLSRGEFPRLKDLFAADPKRFDKFSVALPGMLVDFSKNLITDDIKAALVDLAGQSGLAAARDRMFSGEKINVTENRAVLHTALRMAPEATLSVDGKDINADIQKTLDGMGTFAEAVRSGKWRGYGGKEITDIVNIGIGGSSLGPQFATEALSAYHHPRLTCHFVANVDASDLARVLKRLSPETTLFIIASKTFTTAETMLNATLARDWILSYFRNDEKAVASHFVAASTNAEGVRAFGIAPENMFPFSDWVGGRYSVWSSIGLSTMIMTGPEYFAEFLAGAREMDTHFRETPFATNLPVLMALTGIWYRNFMNYPAYAVIPYHSILRRFPAFLQQLDMESNGKSVTREGKPIPVKTGPIVFGEPGTDAQHSFFQWLHQGPDVVPVDFIAAVSTPYDTPAQRTMLMANFIAQSEALMLGKIDQNTHRTYPGNRPSTTILFDELTPRALGLLIALYEHKVFVQGILWGINSFDQWGVEFGKVLAKSLEAEIRERASKEHDGSTAGLLKYILTRP